MVLSRSQKAKYIVICIILAALSIACITALFNRTGRMFEAEKAAATAESQLSTALADAAALPQTQAELAAATAELESTTAALAIASANLESTSSTLSSLEVDYAAASEQLTVSLERTAVLETELDNLQVNYDRMTDGYAYVYNDPSYQQVMAFLAADTTDENEYVVDVYVCVNFAADVKINALKQGFRCAYINLDFPDSGHAIIAFNTTDRGIMFFEPQSDEVVEPEIGVSYWQCIVAEPGTYYTEADYDDTIVGYTIIW